MKWLFRKLGVAAFWLSLPLTYLYVRGSQRSRILLVAGDQVLVCQTWHGPGRWSLPGGGIHKSEQPVDGATRELREETGIRLEPSQLNSLGEQEFKGYGLRFPCHYFVAQAGEQLAIKPRFPEIIDAAWLDYKTLNSKNSEPDVIHALEAWTASTALLQ